MLSSGNIQKQMLRMVDNIKGVCRGWTSMPREPTGWRYHSKGDGKNDGLGLALKVNSKVLTILTYTLHAPFLIDVEARGDL